MADKFAPVTDEAEIEELTKETADISVPFTFKPNGHLWADPEELRLWRAVRADKAGEQGPVS